MGRAAGEQLQGLSSAEKERRRLVGANLTVQAQIIRQFDLSVEDQRRMHTLAASDPAISDYNGFPAVQAQAIEDEHAAQRRAEDSLRVNVPAAAILGTEQLAPAVIPEGHMYD